MNATDLPLTTSDFFWRPDCRHFIGGLPCKHWRPCPGCTLYDPVTHRILIVMLKRMGDMLIASPLPARIKAEHPGAHITWLVGAESAPIVEMIPHVDRVLTWETETAHTVLAEHYDAVYSFERHPAVAGLVPRISAEHHSRPRLRRREQQPLSDRHSGPALLRHEHLERLPHQRKQ